MKKVEKKKAKKKAKNNNTNISQKYLLILSLLVLLALMGTSYSYFSARVTKIRETKTKIETNQLDLIYTGVGEIDYDSMIPGDKFIKTFTVENLSNRYVSYNIYFENVLNEFNEDLIFVLVETDASGTEKETITSETPLPVTNSGKSYIAQNIEINARTIKYYTLKVEYKYLKDSPQNDYQGKRFNGTLGIDTNPLGDVNMTSERIDSKDIEYTTEYNDCTDVECAVNELYEELVGD